MMAALPAASSHGTPAGSLRSRPSRPRFTLRQRAVRAFWFALAWLALGRVGPADLVAGLLVAVLAGEVSLWLLPPVARRPRIGALGVFALHFLRRSGAAGVAVARLVLAPRLALAPGLITVECGLPDGLMRQAFAATISLQPGALPAGEEGDALVLHALDVDGPVLEELQVDLGVFLNAVGAPPQDRSPPEEAKRG